MEILHDATAMRKRRKLLVSLLCAVLAIVLVDYLGRDKEPTYQGKSLSRWVAICSKEMWQDQGWGTNTTEHAKAINAIRHIGTNAFPLLLNLIDGPPPGPWQAATGLSYRLPDGITGGKAAHWLRQSHHHIVLRASDAQSLSEALGPVAAPIATELVQRLSSTNWTGHRDLAKYALACIGPEAIAKSDAPRIAELLNDQDGRVRWAVLKSFFEKVLQVPELTPLANVYFANRGPSRTVNALVERGTNALPELLMVLANTNTNAVERYAAVWTIGYFAEYVSPLVDVLIPCTRDTNEIVAVGAAVVIARNQIQPELTLPALTNMLADPRPICRIFANFAIAAFGREAEPFLSAVLKTREDDDRLVRESATNAVAVLAPELLP